MFENLTTPADLLRYRLESALEMEHDSLRMLGDLEAAAVSEELRDKLAHHAHETRQQIENLEQVFSLLGLSPDQAPSPTTKGMAKEAAALLRKSDEALHDDVVIAAALGAEHYEIAAYSSLITMAESLRVSDAAALLRQNLEQEQHTSEDLERAAKRHASAAA